MIDKMKLIEEIKSMVRPLLTPDGTAWFDDTIQAHNEALADGLLKMIINYLIYLYHIIYLIF